MCKIRPFVDLRNHSLTVSAPGMPDLVLPLDGAEEGESAMDPAETTTLTTARASMSRKAAATSNSVVSGVVATRSLRYCGESVGCTSGGVGGGAGGSGRDFAMVRVCGNQRAGVSCGDSASSWFTRFLGMPCSLVRAASVAAGNLDASDCDAAVATASASSVVGGSVERRKRLNDVDRAFANEAQYLLISTASVAKVNEAIRDGFLEGECNREGERNEGRGEGNHGALGRLDSEVQV